MFDSYSVLISYFKKNYFHYIDCKKERSLFILNKDGNTDMTMREKKEEQQSKKNKGDKVYVHCDTVFLISQ